MIQKDNEDFHTEFTKRHLSYLEKIKIENLLYHYTNEESYQKISDSGYIHSTNINSFSDKNEFKHVINLFRDEISLKKYNFNQDVLTKFFQFCEIDSGFTNNLEIICFTSEETSKYHLKNFGEKKVVFNPTKNFINDEFVSYLAPVIYKEKIKKKMVRGIIQSFHDRNLNKNLETNIVLLGLFQVIVTTSSFLKSAKYLKEREIRLISILRKSEQTKRFYLNL